MDKYILWCRHENIKKSKCIGADIKFKSIFGNKKRITKLHLIDTLFLILHFL